MVLDVSMWNTVGDMWRGNRITPWPVSSGPVMRLIKRNNQHPGVWRPFCPLHHVIYQAASFEEKKKLRWLLKEGNGWGNHQGNYLYEGFALKSDSSYLKILTCSLTNWMPLWNLLLNSFLLDLRLKDWLTAQRMSFHGVKTASRTEHATG